ncbi:MAG: hypothetical protein WBD40_08510 [Tepidisphaeraceae bacterium]
MRRFPLTFWLGLAIIAICEIALIADVLWTGRGAIHTTVEFNRIEPAHGLVARFARWVAVNMTPLAWPGYLLLLGGFLTYQTGRSPARARPHHFACLIFASILIWCVFDWINFYFIRAWTYIGMPDNFWDRAWGYVLAFGAVVPAMLMSGQVFLSAGVFDRARGRAWQLPRWVAPIVLVTGAGMFAWPLIARDPVTNYTLWMSLVFMLDPLNLWLGRPSVLRDWQNGWYGRTLAAFAGGLLCGLLWEFWNYWALAKWTYDLPFLGAMEHVRYFEMPVIGLLGFIPFGLACWVMWQTMRIPLDGLVEPLPDDRHLI